MRLDKYLKVSRLIKRRTLAKEVADKGRIQVNGQTAKAGTVIKEGDELSLQLGPRKMTVRVTGVKEHASKEEANSLYEILKEERVKEDV
ncbi:RNA-binding S4 domain-containing protein [Bacillus fonticola]|uniref:RNA-binding S4 domain-containing protein n=1 Tax=Bacillus fonticola TaxID=2728853 RepID=UPI0014739D11|nr:RNA-binding S4 domain-containing protein [Bacillus fonticola]